MTNRISSSIGRTSRLTAHIRVVADLSVRGPLSSSGSATASIGATWLQSSGRLAFGCRGLLALLVEIGLRDPTGQDARLHDYALGLVARDLDAVENARVLGRLAAFLALGPAD